MKKIMAVMLSLLACTVLLAGCNTSSESNEEQSLKVYSFSGENEYISVSNGVIILDGKDEICYGGDLKVMSDDFANITTYSTTIYINGSEKETLLSNPKYEIPPEALEDEQFAAIIKEAEKYLGFPYVWGGSSPSTSFDCSGFVSYVYNNCGLGWNFGRLGAEGLRQTCAYVSPANAKPGDLIFFQGTYDTTGASHVGIYVGNNTMLHCGDPIQYSDITSSYWQQHFYQFGRLPSP